MLKPILAATAALTMLAAPASAQGAENPMAMIPQMCQMMMNTMSGMAHPPQRAVPGAHRVLEHLVVFHQVALVAAPDGVADRVRPAAGAAAGTAAEPPAA